MDYDKVLEDIVHEYNNEAYLHGYNWDMVEALKELDRLEDLESFLGDDWEF